jgi:hypothetical protein
MTEPKADPGRSAEDIRRRWLSSGVGVARRQFTLAAALIVLSSALGILVVWRTSSSLLIIFAGILFASFFRRLRSRTWSHYSDRPSVAINAGYSDTDRAVGTGRHLGGREDSRTGKPFDTGHGCAA